MANAGHVPPLVIGRSVREIAVEPGILLGLFDDADIEEETFELQAGECLMLFTDGVTEAISAEGSFFKVDGLMRCLEDALPFSTAESVVDAVSKSVESFANEREQFDDVTVLARHLREPRRVEPPIGPGRAELPAEPGRVELPVDMSSFSILRDAIMDKAPDRAGGMRACLACEEAFTNIVSYSGAQGIWITVDGDGESLRVVIEDDGAPFDPFAVRVEEKPFEELDEGGMGIGIIREMTCEASYHRANERNVLELVF